MSLGNLTHLREDHGANLLSLELLLPALVLHLDNGSAAGARGDGERPMLHVGLNSSIGELTPDETLGTEDGVGVVLGIGSRFTDETFGFRKMVLCDFPGRLR